MRRVPVFLLLVAVLMVVASRRAEAGCHVVTSAGAGTKNGADWNNAMAGVPATLVRGDIYYLADGIYSPYTFTTPDSGTTPVTIKKAVAADHCIETGWNASTMGSSQAIFSPS